MIDELATRKTLCDIARSAFEIVNQKLDADQRLARELRSSDTASRQFVREESISEAMAIALRERFPQHVELSSRRKRKLASAPIGIGESNVVTTPFTPVSKQSVFRGRNLALRTTTVMWTLIPSNCSDSAKRRAQQRSNCQDSPHGLLLMLALMPPRLVMRCSYNTANCIITIAPAQTSIRRYGSGVPESSQMPNGSTSQ